MKKNLLIFVLLSLSPIASLNAYAAGFSLRNDIHFGDTYEEVKEKETFILNDLKIDENDPSISTASSEHGSIANIDDSWIVYQFKDNALYEMDYCFGRYMTESNTDSEINKVETLLKEQYSMVTESLKEKYGTPLYIEEGKEFKFHTHLWDDYNDLDLLLYFGMTGGNIGFDEWLVEADDGNHITIDACASYIGNKNFLASEFDVAYMHIPADEWNDSINSAIERKNNLDNDL